MTHEEMSNTFDTLFNNVNSNQAAGLNEYEKSVFLTKAQSMLVKEYFNARTDGVGGGFDGTEKRQYDFSMLVKTETLKKGPDSYLKLDRRSVVYLFPEDYFLSVNEVMYDGKYQYSVLPISYSDYRLLMLKPYNFPVKRAVWRILTGRMAVENSVSTVVTTTTTAEPTISTAAKTMATGVEEAIEAEETEVDSTTTTTTLDPTVTTTTTSTTTTEEPTVTTTTTEEPTTGGTMVAVAEVIGKFDKVNAVYQMRYVRTLKPIILDELSNYGEDVTIEGESEPMDCELPKEVHQEIVERAVALAQIAWNGSTATAVAAQQQQQNNK